jgi:hypothetical protein
MTRPHSTLAEPTATFIYALSGSDGTADPVLAPPVTDFFGDATADPVIHRGRAVVLAVEQQEPAAAPAPVSTAAAAAPPAVPAQSPTSAQRQPVPGLAPRRPAGAAPERVAVAPGMRMPLRYSAPQYAPQSPQPPQYSPQSSRQRPPPRPQGATPRGQWPPGAPRGQWPPPAGSRAPQRAVAQRPGQARPAAASYSSPRQPQLPPRTTHPHPRPGAPTAKGPGKASSKAAAGWSVFLAIILFLLFSGAGREVLDALAELLNR